MRREALRYLTRLKRAPQLELDLHNHPQYGDLSDCKKIYFDEGPHLAPKWRIVYRLIPNAANPTAVEIVSIGRRRHAEAYTVAVRRLRR